MRTMDSQAKYDRIGSGYNNTRKPDPYLVDRMLHHLQPSKENYYLDIGCGTGNYTDQFQKRGFSFIGIDPSETMLSVARDRSTSIDWKQGSAENTLLENESVDGITAGLTIHHWDSLQKGFAELYRVLKPSGKLVVFTSTPRQMQGYWLNHYFPKMLEDSMVQMPSFDAIVKALSQSGFVLKATEPYSIQPDLQDKFLYCGKENPNVYFDEQIRKGISSFADLSNQEEVNNGLAQLKVDIESGAIQKIMNDYHNDLGDYLYIIVEKN